MAIEKIQAIRGMSDMLPEDAPLWHFFEKEASSLAKLLLWCKKYNTGSESR